MDKYKKNNLIWITIFFVGTGIFLEGTNIFIKSHDLIMALFTEIIGFIIQYKSLHMIKLKYIKMDIPIIIVVFSFLLLFSITSLKILN